MSKFLIIGLDYFGINLACALAEAGHFVMGLDHKPPVDRSLVQLGAQLKNAHVAGVVNRRTGARFPAPPVFLKTIDLLFGKLLTPPLITRLSTVVAIDDSESNTEQ